MKLLRFFCTLKKVGAQIIAKNSRPRIWISCSQFDEEQKSKDSGLLKSKLAGPAWQNDTSSPSDAAHYLAQVSNFFSLHNLKTITVDA